MAARAIRGGMRPRPRCLGASKRLRRNAGISGIGAARPGGGAVAARIRTSDHARLPGVEDMDGDQGAWGRQIRPPHRPEHRAGPVSKPIDRRQNRVSNWWHRAASTSFASDTVPPTLAGDALKALNIEIMLRLQEEGIAALSDTTVGGRHCLRAAINNHRTRYEDLDLLIREVVRLGTEIVNCPTAS